MNWTIAQALQNWQIEAEIHGDENRLAKQISNIRIDSRLVGRDDVFVALRGERHDAHDFIDDALVENANAVIVDRQWRAARNSTPEKGAFIVVEDTLTALQKLAWAYRKHCNPKVTALTGSNGKTTTKEFAANILEISFKTHKTQGNLNNHIGLPLTLLSMPADTEIVMLEMGMNHAGEIAKLCEIAEPEIGLITNIARAHTEFLGDIHGVRRAKQELFEAIAETGLALVNLDDPNVRLAAKDAGVKEKMTFSFEESADVAGTALQLEAGGNASFRWREHNITLDVPGLHNAQNALAAIATGVACGVENEKILAGLHRTKTAGGRLTRLEIGGRRVFDDTYNANPESMCAAIDFLAALPGRENRFLVLGDMRELGETEIEDHLAIIEYAVLKRFSGVLVFGDLMQAALKKHVGKFSNLSAFDEKTAIAGSLMKHTQPGDTILIKGSRGLKMEEVLFQLSAISHQLFCFAIDRKTLTFG